MVSFQGPLVGSAGHHGHPTPRRKPSEEVRLTRGAGPQGGADTQECAVDVELVRQRVWRLPSWPCFHSNAQRKSGWQREQRVAASSSPAGTSPGAHSLSFAHLGALVPALPQFSYL